MGGKGSKEKKDDGEEEQEEEEDEEDDSTASCGDEDASLEAGMEGMTHIKFLGEFFSGGQDADDKVVSKISLHAQRALLRKQIGKPNEALVEIRESMTLCEDLGNHIRALSYLEVARFLIWSSENQQNDIEAKSQSQEATNFLEDSKFLLFNHLEQVAGNVAEHQSPSSPSPPLVTVEAEAGEDDSDDESDSAEKKSAGSVASAASGGKTSFGDFITGCAMPVKHASRRMMHGNYSHSRNITTEGDNNHNHNNNNNNNTSYQIDLDTTPSGPRLVKVNSAVSLNSSDNPPEPPPAQPHFSINLMVDEPFQQVDVAKKKHSVQSGSDVRRASMRGRKVSVAGGERRMSARRASALSKRGRRVSTMMQGVLVPSGSREGMGGMVAELFKGVGDESPNDSPTESPREHKNEILPCEGSPVGADVKARKWKKNADAQVPFLKTQLVEVLNMLAGIYWTVMRNYTTASALRTHFMWLAKKSRLQLIDYIAMSEGRGKLLAKQYKTLGDLHSEIFELQEAQAAYAEASKIEHGGLVKGVSFLWKSKLEDASEEYRTQRACIAVQAMFRAWKDRKLVEAMKKDKLDNKDLSPFDAAQRRRILPFCRTCGEHQGGKYCAGCGDKLVLR